MEVFDADLSHFNPNNPFAGDEKLPVQFLIHPSEDQAASVEAGRPIFRDDEYIKIFNSKDNIVFRPVRETDKQRWPRQYQAWKLSGESTPGATGTPLNKWPVMSYAQAEEFKYFKIFTVEQLADFPDSQAGQIPGIQRLKTMAKAYVEACKGEVPMLKMQMELDSKQGQIDELQSEVRRLTKMVEKLNKE